MALNLLVWGYDFETQIHVPTSPLLREWYGSLQMHLDNYAYVVGQACSAMGLHPTPPILQFRGPNEYLADISQFIRSGFFCQQEWKKGKMCAWMSSLHVVVVWHWLGLGIWETTLGHQLWTTKIWGKALAPIF